MLKAWFDNINEDLPEDPKELKKLVQELRNETYELKLDIAIRKGAQEILKKRWAPTQTG